MDNKIKLELIEELASLFDQKQRMVDYLKLKLSQEDWHGVADAAMDIREIISEIKALSDIVERI
jgi:hypothetical protein